MTLVDRLGFGPTMTLRKRIGMLAALAAGISVLIVSVATYWMIRMSLSNQLDNSLVTRARGVVAAAKVDPAVLTSSPDVTFGAADTRIELVFAGNDQAPTIVVPHGKALPNLNRPSSRSDQATPEERVALGQLDSNIRTTNAADPTDPAQYRVAAVPLPSRFNSALVISQPLTDTQNLVNRIGLLMAALSVAGIAIAAWAGVAVARSGLRPIQDLTEGTEQVARTGELRPVPVRGTDELARLATSFNTMLGALGAVRERERRLIADAGHELRTPLTSMRTNLDLLAQSDAQTNGHHVSAEDRTAIIADVRAQIEELTVLIGDLVELSRESPAEQRVRLDLAEIVRRSIERVQRRAPGIRFAVDITTWPVVGDPHLLERAVTNLLDNAAKWSPERGTVAVSLHEGVLSVADQGPGVAPEDLPHVFDRFYRSEEARSKPGSGLGLSIVAQAAARHGGSVTATRSPSGGAEFLLRLPGDPDAGMPPGPDDDDDDVTVLSTVRLS
jgi:two-component system, OmpR family, sensor histidine kinase MprB